LKNNPPPVYPFQFRGPGAPAPRAPQAPYQGVDIFSALNRPPPALLPAVARKRPARQKTPAEISHLYEVGLTSIAMSFHESALQDMKEVTALAPDHVGAWKALASLLRLADRDAEADEADARAASIDASETPWADAAGESSPARLERLDRKLKAQLEKTPDEDRATLLRDMLFASPLDVAAMRYLANEEHVADDEITALNLLERALLLSPGYLAARVDFVELLLANRQNLAAFTHSAQLLENDPHNLHYRKLRADAAMQMERFDEAVVLYESILAREPKNIGVLTSYGNLLKTLGRREESVAAFRTVLSIRPGTGSAYFGLSELKAKYLTTADVIDMHRYLSEGVADHGSRKCMAYALGATLERARDYKGSFEAYSFGAAACQAEVADTFKAYDPQKFEERMARIRSALNAETMARCMAPADAPTPATTPIFIIGMPRAGSTLVEQILASHSMIEGTRELPVVTQLVKKVGMSRVLVCNDVYPECVVDMNRRQLDALGKECLAGIADFRKTTLPYVIDKRPWNWHDVCFIKLILPHARFIDIRRLPMAAGFAMFKQLLPDDAAFSFDLGHIGHYYRTYAAYMDYVDSVMPGSILRVSYPELVDDTETQIRRMLDYCGVPFEEGCLRFWQTDRAVLTPSAEQVRRPIFRDALEQWKNYEPWLSPLRESLGDLAELA
jgi:tetratricopeptide (TPR) repeat protein